MELQPYFDRIGYSGTLAPSIATLRELHRCHLYTIPFENLDIALQREITLDFKGIYDKIVLQGRGGFCYEQNALFWWALRSCGFDVQMLSARVARADGSYGPEFDHMLLLVRIAGEPWIADVGFGDLFLEPLRFDLNKRQFDRGLEYQIVAERDGYLLSRREGAEWRNQYLFTLQSRQLSDFAPMCVYQQTSPESVFTRKRVCSRATPSGRITLTADSFIVTQNGTRTERRVESTAEFESLLRTHFGIPLRGFPPMPGAMRSDQSSAT